MPHVRVNAVELCVGVERHRQFDVALCGCEVVLIFKFKWHPRDFIRNCGRRAIDPQLPVRELRVLRLRVRRKQLPFKMHLPGRGFRAISFLLVLRATVHAELPPAGTYSFFYDYPLSGQFEGSTGTLAISSTGAFTGRVRPLIPLYVDPPGGLWRKYTPYTRFRGQFDESGVAKIVLPPPQNVPIPIDPPHSAITLELRYDTHEGPKIKAATATDLYGTAYRIAPGGVLVGNYTAALIAPAGDRLPRGYGWVAMRIEPSGTVRINGRTATGAVISTTTYLRSDGRFWFNRYVHYKEGFYRKSVAFYDIREVIETLDGPVHVQRSQTERTMQALLRWNLTDRRRFPLTPWAFFTEVEMRASSFALTKPLFAFATPDSGRLRVTMQFDDVQPSVTAFVDLATRSGELRVVGLTAPLQSLRFTRRGPSAGTFQGKLQFPNESFTRRFSGVILQNENVAMGYYEVPEPNRMNSGQIKIEVENDSGGL